MGIFDDLIPQTAPTTEPTARITVRPAGRGGGMFDDLIPSDTAQSLTTGFLNQGSAASQGTTPNITAHMPQLISDDLHQSDAGEILYRDPSTGNLAPTDQNKQIALRDPSDNRIKLFARTPVTNEGRLSSAGRLLMTGLGAGAPTRLPGGPGMAMAPKARGPVPTLDALDAASKAGYRSPEVKNLEVKAPSLTNWAEQTKGTLFNEFGLDENLAPKTFKILDRVGMAPKESFVTGSNLDSLRKILGNAAKEVNPTTGKPTSESTAAGIAKNALMDYWDALPQADVIAGSAAGSAAKIKEANVNYARFAQSGVVERKQMIAELRAAGSHSGMNVGNALRQRIADTLIKPGESRNYTPEALAKMNEIVKGSKTENVIRGAGNFLGGGGGMGAIQAGTAAGATGVAILGPIGAVFGPAAPIVGFALKSLQNALSVRQIGQLSELIRSQSPLAAQMQEPLSAWAKAAQSFGANPTPRTISQVTIAARNLANNLKDAGITVTPADIMRSLRAPAENEQP